MHTYHHKSPKKYLSLCTNLLFLCTQAEDAEVQRCDFAGFETNVLDWIYENHGQSLPLAIVQLCMKQAEAVLKLKLGAVGHVLDELRKCHGQVQVIRSRKPTKALAYVLIFPSPISHRS